MVRPVHHNTDKVMDSMDKVLRVCRVVPSMDKVPVSMEAVLIMDKARSMAVIHSTDKAHLVSTIKVLSMVSQGKDNSEVVHNIRKDSLEADHSTVRAVSVQTILNMVLNTDRVLQVSTTRET